MRPLNKASLWVLSQNSPLDGLALRCNVWEKLAKKCNSTPLHSFKYYQWHNRKIKSKGKSRKIWPKTKSLKNAKKFAIHGLKSIV